MTLFVRQRGAIGGWAPLNMSALDATTRRNEGFFQGQKDAKPIIDNLTAGETIKTVTHSMGAAYAKGYVEALQTYINDNKLDVKIEYEIDFAPFQPDDEANAAFGTRNLNDRGKGSVPTFQASHNDDDVAGNKKMKGAKQIDTSADKAQDHSITSFKKTIKKLGKFVK